MCEFCMMNCEMIRPLFTGLAGFHSYIPTSIHALPIVLISFIHLSSQSNEQGIPRFFKRQLHIGQDFKYTCCAKRNATIWFRWGIYLPGSDHDPVPHYSRATVKGMPTYSTPSPPTPSNLELDTPPTSEGSHVTKEHTTEDDTENTTVPLDVSTDEPNPYSTLTIISVVVLILAIGGFVIYCQRNQICGWFNSIRSQDRSINEQDLARKPAKKLRRRFLPTRR
ncbi:uncharacterized protein LOC116306466 [Actinia tenebrosa]|uniref:Uncharacterized protein LOC116306466 n=1 Tax=Actinia tenebrosa TaxID=6105 RepID=A0A6P8J4F5_ACTTE|nr:uncharacterized protein LOC116306466 [Actinia tenebrosa]